MKRIEVSLNLDVVAPLLDFIKAVTGTLQRETAFAADMAEADREMQSLWREGLIRAQVEDCGKLMALFGPEFLESGKIELAEDTADSVLRAASAIRLKLREMSLRNISDATLEGGEVNPERLTEPERMAFSSYLFLATLQEIIIKHLGG